MTALESEIFFYPQISTVVALLGPGYERDKMGEVISSSGPTSVDEGDKHSRSTEPNINIRCHHKTASMEPAQFTVTAAVVSFVNTSRIILDYMQNWAKRRQHEADFDEDMDTDIPESIGCGNWDIMGTVGLVDTVER
ncbi:hypothetical protein UY3_16213 [Chelonia mydas]|uniref:Uncharacterized protein n=1 Tax=Chelonia mydas TaxID=8469 RepID=M7AQ29_CHEMY|nr:hypothetical protein UY3_16213 [Chelonia mydas]